MTSETPKIVRHKRKPLTEKQIEELKALASMPDEEIDFSDIPETTEEDWKNAVRGRFYRPVKHQVTLRLDLAVVNWFRQHAKDGRGYQTDINQALRDHITAADRKSIRKKAG